jgi:DNA-directed RNA polymerase specialized sigma24 family protein
MTRDEIDFHAIPERQWPVDERLRNWARWCRGASHRAVHPMFRGYKSSDVHSGMSVSDPVDTREAVKLQKVFVTLPELHRHAIQWHYVYPVAPRRMAQALGLTPEGLAKAVIDGRDMLKNRGA